MYKAPKEHERELRYRIETAGDRLARMQTRKLDIESPHLDNEATEWSRRQFKKNDLQDRLERKRKFPSY